MSPLFAIALKDIGGHKKPSHLVQLLNGEVRPGEQGKNWVSVQASAGPGPPEAAAVLYRPD